MVKVLVATTEAQDSQGDDFAWAVDGELVFIPTLSCEGHECGCRRAFAGMASNQGTTTALVVDRPDISRAQLATALADSLDRQNAGSGGSGASRAPKQPLPTERFGELFGALSAALNHFSDGTILERDGFMLRKRAQIEPMPTPFGTKPPSTG